MNGLVMPPLGDGQAQPGMAEWDAVVEQYLRRVPLPLADLNNFEC